MFGQLLQELVPLKFFFFYPPKFLQKRMELSALWKDILLELREKRGDSPGEKDKNRILRSLKSTELQDSIEL